MRWTVVFMTIIYCGEVWGQEVGANFNSANQQLIDNVTYDLSVVLANSQHMQSTRFDPASGQLIVQGSVKTFYPDTKSSLVVDYVADKNGYRASYKISAEFPPASALSFQTRLSGESLKGLAGRINSSGSISTTLLLGVDVEGPAKLAYPILTFHGSIVTWWT